MKPLAIVLLCCTLISPVVSADVWNIEIVDSSSDNISGTSLVLDADNNPHISYQDQDSENGAKLKYAYWNGSSWEITVIDTGSTEDGLAHYTSIALDSEGHPRIAYTDQDTEELKYASWNGSSWVITVVTTANPIGFKCSLCIDSEDNPSIAFDAAIPSITHLWYARLVGVTWYISLVDPGYAAGLWPSMALDGNDNPHISYLGAYYDDMRYAVLGPEVWSLYTVESGNVGRYSSIAIDDNNRPHISYFDDHPIYNVNYAYYNGSTWDISIVNNVGDVLNQSSIAIRNDGEPTVTYYSNTYNCLMYARYAGSAWINSVIDDDPCVGFFSSLAFDSENKPHVSYREALGENRNLRYAYYGYTGIEEEEEGDPGIVLSDITPNPTTGSANISFSLQISCDINLDVFDITGRKVAVLAEGTFSSGTHETEISELGSGVYFCMLRAGDFVDTKMLVVIK
ncbi:MAG: T9SS type A sorting domain-containing protein [Candidatus Sabulitectum sp.]|nr:T9SS type A sorting domain-containing protein [Candidatus Sabulitectum sp.]